MIYDWTGQHLYVGDWNAWSYNPYGVEEGVYVPDVLTYYGDIFGISRPAIFTDIEIDNRYTAGLRPDIFVNIKSDTKYSGEHKPDIFGDVPINIDPQPYPGQIPVYTMEKEYKHIEEIKPIVKRDVPQVEYIDGHRPILKK
jgi:hypothetical protein